MSWMRSAHIADHCSACSAQPGVLAVHQVTPTQGLPLVEFCVTGTAPKSLTKQIHRPRVDQATGHDGGSGQAL